MKLNFFKKALLLSSVFLIVLPILITAAPKASAYNTWYGGKMIGGIGQSGNNTRYYWFNTSNFNSTWQNRIDDAMYAWCHTGTQGCGVYTSAWFYRTTTQSYSVIDFHSSTLPNNVCGITTFYVGTGSSSVQVYPASSAQNWTWAKIRLATTFCDSGVLTSTQKIAMVEHEIGHAFGLGHVNNTACLMYPKANICTANKPTSDECYGINSLYGGYAP